MSLEAAQHYLLRRQQVEGVTGLSRSAIYSRLDSKSRYYDPTFPRPISLGANTVAWVEAEIQAWINSKITLSRC